MLIPSYSFVSSEELLKNFGSIAKSEGIGLNDNLIDMFEKSFVTNTVIFSEY